MSRCLLPLMLIFLINKSQGQEKVPDSDLGSDSTKSEIFMLNLNIGLNANFIDQSDNFYSGYTGLGLFLEAYVVPRLSILFALNSLNIRSIPQRESFIDFSELNSTELNFKIRYRLINRRYSIYPEFVFGFWKKNAPLYMLGLGSEINFGHNIQGSLTVDYSTAVFNWPDVEGNWGTSNNLKYTLELKYRFSLKRRQ